MLAISFISAVNRKRKKRREARGLGSSTDDDSEQEAHRPGAGAAAAPGPEEPPAADTRSIVSGYSTLSTMDRSECSGPGARRAGAGDDADDERSELSLADADADAEGARRARRPSFSSHRLMPCDTLARRRLARGRADAEAAAPPGSASSSSPESPRAPAAALAAAAAALGARPSRLEALRLRLRGSADDSLAVRLRRPLSPDSRRRRSSWRRHTVLVQSPLPDLGLGEWTEPGGGAQPAAPRARGESKDSGLSSLESAKARAAPAAAPPPAPAGPAPPQSQAPRRSAASRVHQCL